MCQFIETIRVKDGRIFNLTYHEERMNRTRKEVWGKTDWLKITGVWSPEELPLECSKLRFVYDEAGIHDLTCTPYTRKEILSLRLVYDNNITYPYKSVDRSTLNELKNSRVIVTKYLLFVIITSQILPIPTSHCMTGSNGLPPLPHSFLVRCGRVCLTKECFRSVRYSYLTFHNTSR